MPDFFAGPRFSRREIREQRCVPDVDLRAWTLVAGDRSPQDRGGRGDYLSACVLQYVREVAA